VLISPEKNPDLKAKEEHKCIGAVKTDRFLQLRCATILDTSVLIAPEKIPSLQTKGEKQ